uniref:Cleavage/polyadenylation specificity factor A subunit N-terminal domain-containing protein n=1 Tax=Anopheles epiroticus TaxID=199890 RepID=A0A182PTE2_9DIPT
MSCKYLAHWKLPKHNFYPISMVCAVDNDQHSTTVIVASTEQVMSLSLTSIKRVQHEGKVFTHCDVELDEPIRELKKTKLNQVFLTSADGQFMVYDAGKQMFVQIDKCNRILHVEPGPEKDQLIVVRRLPGVTTMVLEVIEIAEGCTSFETVKSCELLIESIDSTARLSLKSLIVNEVNEQFLGNFLGFSKLTVGDQVLLVAANNSLYWLQEQGNGESDLISVRF